MENLVKIVGRITDIRHPQDRYTVFGGEFGVFSVNVYEVKEGEILPRFGRPPMCNIPVAGKVDFDVALNGDYTLVLSLVNNKTYGEQYEIQSGATIHKDMSEEEIFWIYLSTIATDRQYNSLLDANEKYGGMRQAFENGDIGHIAKAKYFGTDTAKKMYMSYKENEYQKNLLIMLKDFDFTSRAKAKLLKIYNTEELMQDFVSSVKANFYIVMDRVDGWGWMRTDKYARGVEGYSETCPQRIHAFVKYWFNKQANELGHSWMYNGDLCKAIREVAPNITNEQIKDYVQDMLPEAEGREGYNDKAELYIDRNSHPQRIGSMALRKTEESISANLFRLMRTPNYPLHFLEQSIVDKEEELGLEFTDEQKEVMRAISDNKVVVLTSGAGHGKSYTMIPIVEAARRQGLTFKICSLSGKASLNIAEITNAYAESSTIHRLLRAIPDKEKEKNGDTKNAGSAFDDSDGYVKGNKSGYPCIHASLIIVDEVSMIGGFLFKDLLENIPDYAKLVLIGDEGQLEAIGYANILHDLKASQCVPVFKLTKVLRQAARSGIISDSFKIYNKQQFVPADLVNETIHGELQDFRIIPRDDKEEIVQAVREQYGKFLSAGHKTEDIIIVTQKRSKGPLSAVSLNKEIQDIVMAMYNGPTLKVYYMDGQLTYTIDYKVGDRVMVTRNAYDAPMAPEDPNFLTEQQVKDLGLTEKDEYNSVEIYNGNVGTVRRISFIEKATKTKRKKVEYSRAEMVVQYPQGFVLYTYDFEKKKPFDLQLGYAATCHKLQGMGVPYVIAVVDPSAYTLLTNEALYTEITRAKKGCVLIGPTRSIRTAVRKSSVAHKQTWLKEILIRDRDEYQKSLEEKEESPFKRLTF